MDRTELVHVIAGCLREVRPDALPAITEQTRLVEDIDLDSLANLELLMAIEERLAVSFSPDTIDVTAFPTVGSLADFVAGQWARTG